MYMHGEQHTFILCAFMPIKELNIPDGLFVFMLFNVWLVSLMETYITTDWRPRVLQIP